VIDFNYRDVKIKFFLPNLHDHIQKIIYLNKTFYEREMLEDIRNRIEPDSVIFDVGANIGNHSIYFAKICSSRVYSFEPQKSVFAILERNVMLNQLENQILLFNTALGSTSGRGNILVEDTSNLGSSRVVVENNGDIQIDSLDSLMLDKIDRIDLIKIDVEGMELDVLKGSVEILNKFKPLLYIETKSQEDFNRVYSFLKKFGYKPKRQFNTTPTILFEYEGEF
jgi:FkbM family methyltransferase